MKRVLLAFSILLSIQLQAQQEGYADSKGVKIYYRTWGKGTPVLIINGGPGLNSDGFEELAKTLSQNNQTIIYDQRGTGKSVLKKMDTSSLTMALMVEDIENLRKYLNIDRWIVFGQSFGGMLASYYATQHPEAIVAMVLSSSGGIDLDLLSNGNTRLNANLTRLQQDSVNYWTSRINNGDTSYHAKSERAKNLSYAYVQKKEFAPLIAARLVLTDHKINGLMWQNMQRIHFDCSKGLASFNKPVLILQGKDDILDLSLAKKANKVLKNSKLVLLDNCAHYGWLDQKEIYFNELNTFLEKNSN